MNTDWQRRMEEGAVAIEQVIAERDAALADRDRLREALQSIAALPTEQASGSHGYNFLTTPLPVAFAIKLARAALYEREKP